MKGSIVLIIVVLALVGLFAYSYFTPGHETAGDRQTFREKVAKAGGLVENHPVDFNQRAREMAHQAEEKVADVTQSASESLVAQQDNIEQLNRQIKDKTAAMQEKMETAAADAKAKADEMVSKVESMLTEARALLDNEQYKEATQKAQSILAIKPESPEAQEIISQAKAKLAALANQTTEKFQTQLSNTAEEAKAALMGADQ